MFDDALDLPRDGQGRVDGFLVGKAHRLADWAAKKEEERYRALFEKLQKRNYREAVKAEEGERIKRLRAQQIEYARRPEVVARRKIAARDAHRAKPPICECVECGARWCLVFGVTGPRPRFCGGACYAAAWQRAHRRSSGARAYRCGACGAEGHNRRRCPRKGAGI